jgi:hypothetical protein
MRKDPYLDEGMRGYIVRTARQEYWRVAAWYDLEDLIQDGLLCYAKCRARYGELRIKNHPSSGDRKWMMQLVKTAFYRHIMTLSSRAARAPGEVAVSQLVQDDGPGMAEVWDYIAPPHPAEAHLALTLSSLPQELVDLITILAGDGAEALGFERRHIGRRLGRETTNEYYCRLLGLHPERWDIRSMIREYLETP